LFSVETISLTLVVNCAIILVLIAAVIAPSHVEVNFPVLSKDQFGKTIVFSDPLIVSLQFGSNLYVNLSDFSSKLSQDTLEVKSFKFLFLALSIENHFFNHSNFDI
jgi:cytosine/uracil/thiamine/allantoin permease